MNVTFNLVDGWVPWHHHTACPQVVDGGFQILRVAASWKYIE